MEKLSKAQKKKKKQLSDRDCSHIRNEMSKLISTGIEKMMMDLENDIDEEDEERKLHEEEELVVDENMVMQKSETTVTVKQLATRDIVIDDY